MATNLVMRVLLEGRCYGNYIMFDADLRSLGFRPDQIVKVRILREGIEEFVTKLMFKSRNKVFRWCVKVPRYLGFSKLDVEIEGLG